jgi:FAD/FMN-containing dehydrogenase
MSKISEYLNEHLLGEVASSKTIRRHYSHDGSVLTLVPELVMYPRTTSDIRKIARFSWQLAEKGHVLGVTMRGSGSSVTGSAIGKGVVMVDKAHLNSVIHLSVKDRFVHVQPGASVKSVNDILQWNGLYLPGAPIGAAYNTIGGALAEDLSAKDGVKRLSNQVSRLEVVLANGDLIETSRVSKRDVSHKKGLQTFEGDIYRKIDALLDDNEAVIRDKIAYLDGDHAGYAGVAKVRDRDGSINLTPLMIGSEGTLGIISEVVLDAEFYSPNQMTIVATVDSPASARDLADALFALEPTTLETLDGGLFQAAGEKGKVYALFDGDPSATEVGAVVYVSFVDFSERNLKHKLKKTVKLLTKRGIPYISSETRTAEDLEAIRSVYSALLAPDTDTESMPPLVDGAIIPRDRHEEFSKALQELADKHHIKLPLKTNVLSGEVFTRPMLRLDQVGDKQKVFRLISEYAELVNKTGGTFLGSAGEGRLKAEAAWAQLDDDVAEVYKQVKAIFDPYGILNPGVKQPGELKQLTGLLRDGYDQSDLADFAPEL